MFGIAQNRQTPPEGPPAQKQVRPDPSRRHLLPAPEPPRTARQDPWAGPQDHCVSRQGRRTPPPSRPWTVFAGARILLLAGAVWLCGCGWWPETRDAAEWVAPSPNVPWQPPAAIIPAARAEPPEAPAKTPALPAPRHLGDLIDLALERNPDTRAAWHAAQAAAAAWAVQQADLWPRLDLEARSAYSEARAASAPSVTSSRAQTAAVELSWLLLDFGGRQAAIEEKRQALAAASFSHNARIHDLVLQVEEAFFDYLGARALVQALETSVQEAQINLDAARQRHQAGLATSADVLQAQTALSQARLNLQAASGHVRIMHGVLATAVGMPVGSLPPLAETSLAPLPLERVEAAVETYLHHAVQERPDLAAQRARVAQAQARTRVAATAMAPRLTLDGLLGGDINENHGDPSRRNSIALAVRVPLFDALARRNDLIRYRHEARLEEARLEGLLQSAALEVWSSYVELNTAAEQVVTSADLVTSAEQLHKVALGRYREGVGAILDLMAARSSLETARAQRIRAQADWYIALARLSHHAGLLAGQTPHPSAVPRASGKDTLP
jgi:outer membrane protein TolC